MPNKENYLGPLWNEEPKTYGFRVGIPNPTELAEWARENALNSAEATEEEKFRKIKKRFDKFTVGETRIMFENEREWEIELNDSLLESISFKVMAEYSTISGEWANLVVYLTPSKLSIDSKERWELPSKARQIAEHLTEHGVASQAEQGKDGDWVINSFDDSGSPMSYVYLGFCSEEEEKKADPGYEPDFPGPIIICLENHEFSLEMMEALKSIQFVQKLTSYLVDGMYISLDIEDRPNQLMELSEEKEIR